MMEKENSSLVKVKSNPFFIKKNIADKDMSNDRNENLFS